MKASMLVCLAAILCVSACKTVFMTNERQKQINDCLAQCAAAGNVSHDSTSYRVPGPGVGSGHDTADNRTGCERTCHSK